MFWPFILPAQITFGVMLVLVVGATLVSILLKWKPLMVHAIAVMLAIVGFIPSCSMVMEVVDARRFGTFQYATYAEVQDFRVERYLPPMASQITLVKYPQGHLAKYRIKVEQLKQWLDQQWEMDGPQSASQRSELGDGEPVSAEEIELWFQGPIWPPLNNPVVYHSITQYDGGGARYYVDSISGVVYQHAGYW